MQLLAVFHLSKTELHHVTQKNRLCHVLVSITKYVLDVWMSKG